MFTYLYHKERVKTRRQISINLREIETIFFFFGGGGVGWGLEI